MKTLYKNIEQMNVRILTLLFLLLSTVAISQNEGGGGGGGSYGGGVVNGGSWPSVTVTGRSTSYTVRVHTQPGTYTGATPPLPTINAPISYNTGHGHGNGGYGGGGSSSSGNTNTTSTTTTPKNTETIKLAESVKPGESKNFHIKIPQGDLPSTFVAEYVENGVVVGTIEFHKPKDGFFTQMTINLNPEASNSITSITPINVDSRPTRTLQASDGSSVAFSEVANTSSNTVPTGANADNGEAIRSPWSIVVSTGGSSGSQNQADIVPRPLLTPQDWKDRGCGTVCNGYQGYINKFTLAEVTRTVQDCPCKTSIIALKNRLNKEKNDLIIRAQQLLDNAPAIMSTEAVLKQYEKDFADTFKGLGGAKNRIVAHTFDEAQENNFLGRREHTKIVNNAKQILEITKISQFSVDDSDPDNQKLVAEILLKVKIYDEFGEEIATITDHQLAEQYVNDMSDSLTEEKTKSAELIFRTLLGFNPAVKLMYDAIEGYYGIEKERLRQENPTMSETELIKEALISVTQSGLDVAGMVPVAGEIADGINGTIYLVRGDYGNAAISAAALFPFGGQAITGTRVAVKVAKGVKSIAAPIAKNAKEVEALVKIAKTTENLEGTKIAIAIKKVSKTGLKFWTDVTIFKNVKVYKRNDIIDPGLVDKLGRTNKQRMQAGIAPIGPDGKSVNLHHMLQSDAAGIAEMTETFHKTNHKTIHINPNTIPSGIDRNAFNTWKRNYWKNRANDF